MADLLRDYVLKRGRAMLHFETLGESVKRFVERDREPVRGKFDPDAGKYRFEVGLEPTDPGWALTLGDFLYDTRASLDYLIAALVRSTGKQPDNGNQFPIYGIDRIRWQDIDQWWEKDPKRRIVRQLNGTPPGTKAALKGLQPFHGVPTVDPGQHPLFALQVLSNRDKHRRLNLLVHGATAQFVDAGGQPIPQLEGPAPHGPVAQPAERDTYTVTLTVREELDVDVYLLPAYDIRLNEPPELAGDLIDTLARITQFIDGRVLPTIRALL